ncbi:MULTISPECIES: aliphatic sulfonate ABC transporter substrate-binding protein [Pseudomonas]|uniref:Putative aliphatic sulfonates-binding protein n=1 Tax=Pseudomonas lutea TaxID=243924 RepID=A0A9X8M9D2_9PSED|nr:MULTISPECIES: aliphatic sulfonate ABC transporter substrate-binding protein [Pseudomonas]SEP77902.1 sulfonate transport system substrate-binding protein [Pseudomonas lutea]
MKPAFLTRSLILLGTLAAFAFQTASADPAELRIGYQKSAVNLVVAREKRFLETRFPNTQVRYVEFPAGPQLLEALNAGSIDLGATGDIPPIFAQAAGADLLYVGTEPAKPLAEVILVSKDSPIHTLADLKGKKVAFQKGSSSHALLLRALNQAGLNYTDIQPVYLPPADARAAFDQGNVDAWAIWDPFYSAALLTGQVRVLTDGRNGLSNSGSFYLAARPFAERNPGLIPQIFDALNQAEALTRASPEGSIEIMTRQLGLPRAVVASYFSHRPDLPISSITARDIENQQQTADLFYQNRLIPKPIRVADVATPAVPVTAQRQTNTEVTP